MCLGLVPGFVRWVIGIVSWLSGIVSWVLGFVFWVSGFVCLVPGFVFSVLNPAIIQLHQKKKHQTTIGFSIFGRERAQKNNKKAVIQSTTSAASARGGCASSRLDHGLRFYVIWGGCASSRLIQTVLYRFFVTL